MRTNNQRRWRIIRGFVLGWVAAFVFLAIVRGSGTVEQGSAQFDLWTAIVLGAGFGAGVGALAGFAQLLIEERLYRRIPLRRLLVLRVLGAALLLALINVGGFLVVTRFRGTEIGFWDFTFEPGSSAIMLYILTVDAGLVALRQVNLLLGEGNLWRLVRGDFYAPQEAERIIMFLDLRSSTSLAESLGHLRYSRLIQECFDDLGVVADYEARIYQYVGDGVVLTWDPADGLRDRNCLSAFWSFRHRLAERADDYERQYGCRPHFTAGAHLGVVTVTEVGRFKKEIAYHGDTINTAARIQGRCRDLGEDLLVSGALLEKLPQGGHESVPLGSIPLKGKDREVSLFAVRDPDERGS